VTNVSLDRKTQRAVIAALARYQPETNVPQGFVEQIDPGKKYRVVCFDIASANLTKPGMSEGLEAIVQILLKDADPRITITGTESKSRRPGHEFSYGWARAFAVRDYFVERFRAAGRHLFPPATNCTGPVSACPSNLPPLYKALYRAVSIDIKLSGRPYATPGIPLDPDMTIPPRPDSLEKGAGDVGDLIWEIAKDRLKDKLIDKVSEHLGVEKFVPFLDAVSFQYEAFEAWAEANRLGDRDLLRGFFWQGFDEAEKHICKTGDFKKYLRLDLPIHLSEQLEEREGHVSCHNLYAFTRMRDQIMNFGRRAAAAVYGSYDSEEFKTWRQTCGAH
jgi:hypothetical protein